MFRKSLAFAAAVALSGASVVSVVRAIEPMSDSKPAMAARFEGTRISTKFAGAKANKGYVTENARDGKIVLTLSDDFVIPDTPAPHWQVVDSSGNVYLLQRLKIKGDKVNQKITLPAYIHDVQKVQIWCAWAEVNLGEASFQSAT